MFLFTFTCTNRFRMMIISLNETGIPNSYVFLYYLYVKGAPKNT